MPAPVLHAEVARELGEEITGGVLPEGHVLTLAGLEERFARSRTVIREAVRVLESLGLVVPTRRIGVVVQPRSAWSVLSPQVIAWRLASSGQAEQLRSLTELRVAIEPSAARAAALRAGALRAADGPSHHPEIADLAAALVAAAETMRDLGARGDGEAEAYIEADVAFHSLLLRASGNEMFAALASTIAEVLRGRARVGRNPAWPSTPSLEQHLALARAVAAGRAEDAEAVARDLAAGVLEELASHTSAS